MGNAENIVMITWITIVLFIIKTYDARKELEKTCYSAYLISVVVMQWSSLLTRKTRRLSLFQHGIR